MTSRDRLRSIQQRVANAGRSRGLSRPDALTTYAMDRVLMRLSRSAEAKSFLLKGGVLVANSMPMPHRITRDIDLLRRRGPADPDDLRKRWLRVLAIELDDGLSFGDISAVKATHDAEGYEGVKVRIRGKLGNSPFDLQVDLGFGDAVRPKAVRRRLEPFLEGDDATTLLSYPLEAVIAEKVQTLVYRRPFIEHRLKDLLDVVALSRTHSFGLTGLAKAMDATATRRDTERTREGLELLADTLKGRRWESAWAKLGKEKAVADLPELRTAVVCFLGFVSEPWLAEKPVSSMFWQAGGPWSVR